MLLTLKTKQFKGKETTNFTTNRAGFRKFSASTSPQCSSGLKKFLDLLFDVFDAVFSYSADWEPEAPSGKCIAGVPGVF